ncbi:MAG TPA: hypothetical protein VF052_05505 [Solirubrobacterales bacterium]
MFREALNGILRGIALAASVLALAMLAGCGGDDSADSTVAESGSAATVNGQSGGGSRPEDFGEEAGAADRAATGASVQDFLRAFADGDSSTACSLMSASTKENLAVFTSRYANGQPCPEQVEALKAQVPAKRLPQPGRIEVTGVRIDGDRGFVLYRDADGTPFAFPVTREDDAWKVAAIAGARLQENP